jgi:hypothetical protein
MVVACVQGYDLVRPPSTDPLQFIWRFRMKYYHVYFNDIEKTK